MACAVAGASEGLASGTGAAAGTSGMAAGGTAIGASAVGDVAAEGVVTRSEVAGEVSAAVVARLAFEEDLGEAAAAHDASGAGLSASLLTRPAKQAHWATATCLILSCGLRQYSLLANADRSQNP
jgi:hypothetical protein